MRDVPCCRIKYEQTVGDIKKAVAKKLNIPVEKQQLFWQNKELTAARDGTTLLDLGLHTGASLKGYDLVRTSAQALPPRKKWLRRVRAEPHLACAKLHGLMRASVRRRLRRRTTGPPSRRLPRGSSSAPDAAIH